MGARGDREVPRRGPAAKAFHFSLLFVPVLLLSYAALVICYGVLVAAGYYDPARRPSLAADLPFLAWLAVVAWAGLSFARQAGLLSEERLAERVVPYYWWVMGGAALATAWRYAPW